MDIFARPNGIGEPPFYYSNFMLLIAIGIPRVAFNAPFQDRIDNQFCHDQTSNDQNKEWLKSLPVPNGQLMDD